MTEEEDRPLQPFEEPTEEPDDPESPNLVDDPKTDEVPE